MKPVVLRRDVSNWPRLGRFSWSYARTKNGVPLSACCAMKYSGSQPEAAIRLRGSLGARRSASRVANVIFAESITPGCRDPPERVGGPVPSHDHGGGRLRCGSRCERQSATRGADHGVRKHAVVEREGAQESASTLSRGPKATFFRRCFGHISMYRSGYRSGPEYRVSIPPRSRGYERASVSSLFESRLTHLPMLLLDIGGESTELCQFLD